VNSSTIRPTRLRSQRYAPELEQRLRRRMKPTNRSWRVDETYLRVKGRWCYRCQVIRAIKRRVNAKQGFREFQAARRTIQGYEAINIIRKGQVRWLNGVGVRRQNRFINQLFEVAA
jgi:transposase-like protein